MRVLITGATGFLGKQVLERLVDDTKVQEILVTSRQKHEHESKKVKVLQSDLTVLGLSSEEIHFSGIDVVLHLSGLYDLSANYSESYDQNVLGTLNLLRAIKRQSPKASIHFSSTYVVGCLSLPILKEDALPSLPPRSLPYALTKALAEKCIHESGLKARIFRLGILMGESKKGEIEKIDGPYAFMNLLYRLPKLPLIVIPGRASTILPLVPVDIAADVLVESIFEDIGDPTGVEYFGLFDPKCVSVEEFTRALLMRIMPSAKPIFIERKIPSFIMKYQGLITHLPTDLLAYSSHRTILEARRFQTQYGKKRIPSFSQLAERWFEGFERYAGINR